MICALIYKEKFMVTKSQETPPNLEASLAEITQLIEKMEQGDLTLEQSLTHFERGITLIKQAQKILVEAEQKVQILLQNQSTEELGPYSEKNNDA
jgi:exodeoxyribonuclease VII small subunit